MAAADVLKASPLFRGFTETGLTIIAGISHERTFPKGTPLFVENMVGDACLIIGSGQVKLTAKSGSGDVELGMLKAGDSLGALSLIQNQGQRMCSATALSNVSAVEIRYADFQKLLSQKPQACLKLLMNIVVDFSAKLQDNRESLKSLIGRK